MEAKVTRDIVAAPRGEEMIDWPFLSAAMPDSRADPSPLLAAVEAVLAMHQRGEWPSRVFCHVHKVQQQRIIRDKTIRHEFAAELQTRRLERAVNRCHDCVSGFRPYCRTCYPQCLSWPCETVEAIFRALHA
jgi:hypothetical protein